EQRLGGSLHGIAGRFPQPEPSRDSVRWRGRAVMRYGFGTRFSSAGSLISIAGGSMPGAALDISLTDSRRCVADEGGRELYSPRTAVTVESRVRRFEGSPVSMNATPHISHAAAPFTPAREACMVIVMPTDRSGGPSCTLKCLPRTLPYCAARFS